MTPSGRQDAEQRTKPKFVAECGPPIARAIAVVLVLFGLFVVVVERPLYCSHLEAADIRFRFRDTLANASLTMLLIAKSLALLVPSGTASVVMLRRGSPRMARCVFLASVTAIVCFQWADTRVFLATGTHLADFALLSVRNNAGQFASRYRDLLGPTVQRLTLVAAASLASCALLDLVGRVVPALVARPWRESWIPHGLYALILVGGLLSPAWLLAPNIRNELRDALPFAVPWGTAGHRDSVRQINELAGDEAERLRVAYASVRPALESPPPLDTRSLEAVRRPHIVLISVESWRADALTPDITPRLWELSRRGVRSSRHYSSTNCTQFALFSLLYGRWPVNYDQVLDHRIPPQLPHSLASAGYETTFMTSADCRGWRRMGEFLREGVFDRLVQFEAGDYAERDRAVLEETRRVIAAAKRPQFVFLHLNSSHFTYSFPESHAKFRPYATHIDPFNPAYSDPFSERFRQERELLFNRYKNAVHYLDDVIGAVAEDVLRRDTILIATGDHGESMHEDGTYGHPSKLSDVQSKVPFLMVGREIDAVELDAPTSHVDVLPTILSHVHGAFVVPSGAHGRSIFDPKRSTAILLTQGGFDLMRYDPWCDVLLLDSERRMRFLFHRHESAVRVIGLTNDQAQQQPPSATDAHELREAIQAAIGFLPRLTGAP